MIRAALAALTLLLLASPAAPAPAADEAPAVVVWQDATVVPVLTPSLAERLGLEPGPQFEVIDGRHIVVQTRDGNLFDLTGQQALPAHAPLRIESFAVSAGLLVTVRGDRLGWYDDGAIRERIRLPSPGMQVVAGPRQRLYAFGPQGQGSVVYLLDDARVIRLLELEHGRIAAFAAIGERVFFAVEHAIYTAAKGERPALLFVAKVEPPIRSLAADPVAGLLYFSAGETVYAMRAGVAISILRGLAGVLRYSRDGLFVMDPERRWLVKLTGLEKLTATRAGEPAPTPPPAAFKE